MVSLEPADLRQANPRRGIKLAPPKGGIGLLRLREDEIPYGLDEKEPQLVLPVKAALASGRAPVDLDAAAATILLLGAEERLPDDPEVDDVNETLLDWFGDPELALRALARHLPLSLSQKAKTGCP